jgi:hypothetical protein
VLRLLHEDDLPILVQRRAEEQLREFEGRPPRLAPAPVPR